MEHFSQFKDAAISIDIVCDKIVALKRGVYKFLSRKINLKVGVRSQSLIYINHSKKMNYKSIIILTSECYSKIQEAYLDFP